MINDLEAWPEPPLLECDVCIVGAGAAGLALGRSFAGGRLSIVILEAGGRSFEPATQSLNDASVTGLPFGGHREGRVRVLGGTTTKWGGQSLPLTPTDFARRDWVPFSGWPLSAEDLAPYYSRASEFLGLDSCDFGPQLAASLGAKLPQFDPRELQPHFSKWCPEPDMARRHASQVCAAPNVRLVLHANVTRLALDDSARVARVVATSLGGRRLEVAPRAVVLACGGLETPRLLLANRAQRAAGLGNEHDLVGRFLQDHPGAVLGVLETGNEAAVQKAFNAVHRHGVRYTLRFGLSPEKQRREQTLGASGSLMFVSLGDSGFESAKRIYRSLRRGRVPPRPFSETMRVLPSLPNVARAAIALSRGRTMTPNPVIRLTGSLEQQPDRESRVVLGPETDRLGIPKLEIQWRLDDSLLSTARVFANTARQQLEALGAGKLTLAPWLFDAEVDWRLRFVDHYHHIGTARMGVSPRDGVVDADCRVHSTRNLYLSSSAVFPTGGYSNPTMTIIALAFRLAERLSTLLLPR